VAKKGDKGKKKRLKNIYTKYIEITDVEDHIKRNKDIWNNLQ